MKTINTIMLTLTLVGCQPLGAFPEADYENTYQTVEVWEGQCDGGEIELEYDTIITTHTINSNGRWEAAEWEEYDFTIKIAYCEEYARVVYMK